MRAGQRCDPVKSAFVWGGDSYKNCKCQAKDLPRANPGVGQTKTPRRKTHLWLRRLSRWLVCRRGRPRQFGLYSDDVLWSLRANTIGGRGWQTEEGRRNIRCQQEPVPDQPASQPASQARTQKVQPPTSRVATHAIWSASYLCVRRLPRPDGRRLGLSAHTHTTSCACRPIRGRRGNLIHTAAVATAAATTATTAEVVMANNERQEERTWGQLMCGC